MLIQKDKVFTLTNITIIATVLMYFIQTNIPFGSAYLGLNINFLSNGLYYQPISTMFTHGGTMHLLMNMFVLYQFGNIIETYRGKIQFIFLYYVGGILTSIGSIIFLISIGAFENVNLVGASGAISVLLGYMALVDKSQRQTILIWVLAISIFPLLLGLNIAWYSHFIGLALGFILGLIKR